MMDEEDDIHVTRDLPLSDRGSDQMDQTSQIGRIVDEPGSTSRIRQFFPFGSSRTHSI